MLSLLFLEAQTDFFFFFPPSIFFNLSLISFHYKFPLFLSVSAQEGTHCTLTPGLLTARHGPAGLRMCMGCPAQEQQPVVAV